MSFKKIALCSILSSLTPMVAFAQSEMSLEDRVAELEANQSLNIFKLSGYLNTRFDDVDAQQSDPAGGAFDGHTQHLRLRAGINIDAAVSSKINFYSTITASKYMNRWMTQANGVGTMPSYLVEPGESRAENGSQIYLEKAYADYRFSDNYAFSFGRLPTLDGPPMHMAVGKARMGTYPSLGYNGTFDGVAFSYNLGIDKDQSFAARILYTPFSYVGSNTGKLGGAGGLADVTIGGKRMDSKTDFYSVMFEYNLNNTAIANRINVLAMAYQTADLPVAGNLFSAGGSAGTGLIEFKVGGQVALVEFSQVMDSNFDIAIAHLRTKVENSGSINITGLGNIYGYGASSEGETLSGNTTLISARYKWSKMYIGGEYLAGGKNVFNYDPATEVVNGFYSTPGTGMHAYLLYKMTSELGLRVGYMKQDYKSTPFTFGASTDTDREISTVYADLRLDF